MGYFDALTDASFKRDTNGQMLFFPWGTLGRGYVLATEEQHRTTKRFVKRFLLISLPLVVFLVAVVGILYALAVLVPLYAIYAYQVRSLTQGLAKASESLTISESYRNQAASHSLVVLWLLEIASLGFVLIGVIALGAGVNGSSLLIIASTGFFAVCGVAIGYMIRTKTKLNRARRE